MEHPRLLQNQQIIKCTVYKHAIDSDGGTTGLPTRLKLLFPLLPPEDNQINVSFPWKCSRGYRPL